MELLEVLIEEILNLHIVDAICLSKGGWEGWLQCELWVRLSLARRMTVEREVPYADGGYCDLVVQGNPELWVELKAFGVFREGDIPRFLDSVALDVQKLGTITIEKKALMILVIPNRSYELVKQQIIQRGWLGFLERRATYASIFYMPVLG
ncbi:hypothetical protein [Nostoc sp. UHCC 0870]|uniref:hypothetical protein n=1 Tax=Nostoc sp. UHCC 0870 TaxID=2914041 RepID=UPI001EDCEB6F|nr:hypothetical protein [Nostoc sp. UHCC 0870]UKO98628.1 hypothetical protein L6494_02500 [Nostoc sp. UHCC 0870]